MKNDFFAELAIVAEQVMAQRGVNIDSAFEMCNGVLTDLTDGEIFVSPLEQPKILRQMRKRLGLNVNKGGAL